MFRSKRRSQEHPLGLPELVAIALGGMVGGGIFTILGISAAMIGAYTPIAIVIGGCFALLAGYSYVKLGVFYRDEGATYAFVRLTFPEKPMWGAFIGWWVIFGYISTLALYAYTFASYALSGTGLADDVWLRKSIAVGIIALFAAINIWSVRGMGKIEDLMVYLKIAILMVIALVLMIHGEQSLPQLFQDDADAGILDILIVASLTFVAYEGFQLVINAVREMDAPEKNIPRAIYLAIALAAVIYVVIAVGALMAIPLQDLAEKQEYALAAGASEVLGRAGEALVIAGALLATSSAISGTVFGASRQMAEIARDGFMPRSLSKRHRQIPVTAIVAMSVLASVLILAGTLRLILEFGSITFLVVSLLVAVINFRLRHRTGASAVPALAAILGLTAGSLFILYYEYEHQPDQLLSIVVLYVLLACGAWFYGQKRKETAGDG